jgi:hypothetical protein
MKPLATVLFISLFACVLGSGPVEGRFKKPQLVISIDDSISPVDYCWHHLDCSFTQIESMGMVDRLEFVKFMATWRFAPLLSSDQFRALEGVMAFFIRKHLAVPGSWLSHFHAAIVEAVERGAAISLKVSNETGNNPATLKWVEYFEQRKAGGLMDRPVSNAHLCLQSSCPNNHLAVS